MLQVRAAEKGDTHAMFHAAFFFLDGTWANCRPQAPGVSQGGRPGAARGGGGGGGGGGADASAREKAVGGGCEGEAGGGSDFVAAAKFAGKKQGFVFKSGRRGLGYYREREGGATDGWRGHQKEKEKEKEKEKDAGGGPRGAACAQGAGGAGVDGDGDTEQGLRWLEKAAIRKHPLAISFYKLLTLHNTSAHLRYVLLLGYDAVFQCMRPSTSASV